MKRALPLAATAVAALATAALSVAPAAHAAHAASPEPALSPAEVVRAALGATHSLPALHATSADAFTQRSVARDASGASAVHVDRTYHGLRVIGGDAVLHVAKDGTVLSTSQTLRTPLTLSVKPTLTSARAATLARSGAAVKGARTGARTLVVWARTSTPRLAWESVVTGTQADGTPSRLHVVVDARSGTVLDRFDEIQTGTGYGFNDGTVPLTTTKSGSTYQLRDPNHGGLATYDLKGRTGGQGTLFTDADDVWGNGSTSSRQSVAVDAQFGAVTTWDFYKNTFGRNGIDGNGRAPYNRVHYSTAYDNAFWDDSCYCMTYGDGSQLKPLTAIDVAGHEQTHGVTSHTAGLIYSGESGGLNESTSDVFGTLVEFYANLPADKPDYLIGEKLASSPLRYMNKPSQDGSSPDCYYSGVGNLNVHYSSAIGNHAFYLMAVGSGGSGYGASPTCNGTTVSGIGNAAAGAVWYRALTQYMTSNETYSQAKAHMLSAAADLYGSTSTQYAGVKAAWSGVGVS